MTIDPLGNTTSYTYDAMARLIKTTYPDSTTETNAYDASGNRIASADRRTNVTTYVFDALNRLQATIYPDITTNTTVYDGVHHKLIAKSRWPERAMTNGNATWAEQHSISQAAPIEPNSFANCPKYYRPGGKKSIMTKRERRRAKIETVPQSIFWGTTDDSTFSHFFCGDVWEWTG